MINFEKHNGTKLYNNSQLNACDFEWIKKKKLTIESFLRDYKEYFGKV
jgi:hypothetical protein